MSAPTPAYAPVVLEFMKKTSIPEESVIEIKMEDVPKPLTEEQQHIVKAVYEKAKQATQTILEDPQMDNTLKITQTIGQIIKLLEYIKINDKKISGSNKKAVALEVGRLLIKEGIKNDTAKQVVLSIYDVVAEQTLEVMIDVSHVVNTKVQEATASCLDWLCGRK